MKMVLRGFDFGVGREDTLSISILKLLYIFGILVL